MKIVTHSGHFHADELLAVAALLLKYPEAEVIRSRDEKVIEEADIVVDVGQIYNPTKLRFDHHQKGGAGERPNGIPYASFGLVWKEYGEELAGGIEEMKIIDDKLVMPIDANDNGIDIYEMKFSGFKDYTLGDFFETFAYGSETMEDFEKGFLSALPVARDFLNREIKSAQSTASDWKKVKEIYDLAEDKRIIVLPTGMHWKRVLIPLETYYVVSSRQDGQWATRAVPKDNHSFELKKPFPTSWAGLSNETLQAVTGVPSATFCHRDCWLVISNTKEGAIELAKKALNS